MVPQDLCLPVVTTWLDPVGSYVIHLDWVRQPSEGGHPVKGTLLYILIWDISQKCGFCDTKISQTTFALEIQGK